MSKRTQIANPNDPRNVGKTNPNDMFHDENEAESNVVSKVFIGKVNYRHTRASPLKRL